MEDSDREGEEAGGGLWGRVGSRRRRDVGWAGGCVFGEEGWVKLGGGGEERSSEGGGEEFLVLEEEGVDFCFPEGVEVSAAIEGIDIRHHGSRSVDSGPGVSKEFLCPSAQEVAGSVVVGNSLHGVAVTDPPEGGSPDVCSDDAECPSTSGNLTHKGVVVAFPV